MCGLTFLFQISSYLWFCLQDLIKIDRPLLATGSINGLRIMLQNILRGIVGNVLINFSPSNIFLTLLWSERFHQNCQAVLEGFEY